MAAALRPARRPSGRADRDRVAPARLDRLGQEVDVGPARGVEAALEAVDAVLPDADVDRVLLGGDVGPELGAAAVRAELDPERRPGRHLREDRPDDDRDVGPVEAERRAEAAAGARQRGGSAVPAAAALDRARDGASGRSTRIPSRDASQAAW